jgi:hypothetical protein
LKASDDVEFVRRKDKAMPALASFIQTIRRQASHR